jgi:molecular chaperone DnaJ
VAPQREWLEKDYYAALGVSKDATADEIKKAYRRLAREHHPDANPDNPRSEQRFKEIGEAYAVVGDAATRREYDELRRLGTSGFTGGIPGNAGFTGQPGGFGGADLNDLLGQMFGGAQAGRHGGRGAAGSRRPRRGADVETDLHLTFEDAFGGVSTGINVTGDGPCGTCRGSGAAPGSSRVTCTSCGGAGEVAVNQGMFSFAQPCGRCGGSGTTVESPCRTCRGSGRVATTRNLQVRIPAGVRDGSVIRLAGRGQPGRDGGPAGDVLVRVRVAAHPLFGRKGDDVMLELPLSFAEAAAGTTIAVPTPSGGSRRIRIPAGTQPGKVLRVRGEGAPRSRKGGTGDLLVTVTVVVPHHLNREQKRLVAELAKHDDLHDRDVLFGAARADDVRASEPADDDTVAAEA